MQRYLPSLLALALLACDKPAPSPGAAPSATTPPPPSAAPPQATSSAARSPSTAPRPAAGLGPFGDLVRTLSEPGGEFFSDNLISNETSYLQVARPLAAHPAGGVYIGVGPEQNFSYIALTRPRYAFIVDIRRGNLLEHLWLKSLFLEAEGRSHFVALLLGRPFARESAPGPDADVPTVLAHAERQKPDEATFKATLERAVNRIEHDMRVPLDDRDEKELGRIARTFFERGLELRFELKVESGRKYPTLRELFGATDPEGVRRGFLATEEAFRVVQAMQREDRIIPVVGDFAGDGALPAIAKLLREKDLKVNAFYVSNVEQYLLDPPVWKKWVRNVAALPTDGESVFIRCYLDQGKKHPRQMPGHRAATVLGRMGDFVSRQEKTPSRTFFAVSTEDML
jgi:hypothetical protein